MSKSSSSQSSGYRFSFANGQVTNLQEFDNGRRKNESISRNETWAFDGTTLTQTEIEKGRIKVKSFTDADGDGVFTKTGRDIITGGNSGTPSYPSNTRGIEDGYRFSFANGQVTNLQEFDNGRWKNESISRNETWAFDSTTLTQTEIEKGRIKVKSFTDADGDGVFTKTGRDIITGGNSGTPSYPSNTRGIEDGYRFSFANGQVTNLQEFDNGRWKNESISRNETWAFDGTTLTQTEIKSYGTEVCSFSDPNADGIFTKVSEIYSPFAAANTVI